MRPSPTVGVCAFRAGHGRRHSRQAKDNGNKCENRFFHKPPLYSRAVILMKEDRWVYENMHLYCEHLMQTIAERNLADLG